MAKGLQEFKGFLQRENRAVVIIIKWSSRLNSILNTFYLKKKSHLVVLQPLLFSLTVKLQLLLFGLIYFIVANKFYLIICIVQFSS